MLTDFIEYLTEQIGQPYLWGGQHTKLTPSNYEQIIHKREDGRGKYADGTTYADASIAYCKKLFDKGATELFAYDCSGLGMYFLQNLRHIYGSDMTADGMMHKCSGVTTSGAPKKGWWVFRLSNGKASHIGYMVSDTELIEAKGRKFGVVKSKWKKSDWTQWGIPNCFKSEIVDPQPEPQPEPPEPTPPEPEPKQQYVLVIAKSVRVHSKPRVASKTLWIAHNEAWYKKHHGTKRADMYKVLDVADNGWYHIQVLGDPTHTGYITNKPKYTKLLGGD